MMSSCQHHRVASAPNCKQDVRNGGTIWPQTHIFALFPPIWIISMFLFWDLPSLSSRTTTRQSRHQWGQIWLWESPLHHEEEEPGVTKCLADVQQWYTLWDLSGGCIQNHERVWLNDPSELSFLIWTITKVFCMVAIKKSLFFAHLKHLNISDQWTNCNIRKKITQLNAEWSF